MKVLANIININLNKLAAGFCVVTSCFFMQCNSSESTKVHHVGALKTIMHEGKMQGRIMLDSMINKDFYALGAEENLKGEITIINSKPFNSRVENDKVIILNDKSLKATLLVYSKVSQWDTLEIGSLKDIEKTVSKYYKKEPLPFLLKGVPESLKYHVINFNPETDQLSQHKESAFKGEINNQTITVLGFYSNKHQGIFTHHGSNLHMHFVDNDQQLAGHVDELTPGKSTFKLMIPKQ